MNNDGPTGAEATVRYFLELDAYIQATGDTSEWEELSGEACEFCENRLDQARKIRSEGYIFIGGETSVEVVNTHPRDPSTGAWPVQFRAHLEPTKIYNADGTEVFTEGSDSYTATALVKHKDSAWTVLEFGNAKPLQEAY